MDKQEIVDLRKARLALDVAIAALRDVGERKWADTVEGVKFEIEDLLTKVA